MKHNESNTDRIVRLVLAALFFIGAFTLSGLWAMALGILGVVMAATAAIGFCPLYALFGINTCPVDARKA